MAYPENADLPLIRRADARPEREVYSNVPRL